MSIFGKAAVDAAKRIISENESDYAKVWKECLSKYTESDETTAKGCPKNAFVDLCSLGFVVGIQKKEGEELSENGKKAIDAIKILKKRNWNLPEGKSKFWEDNFGTSHQGHLDIIIALKNAGLLNDEAE